MENSKEYLKGIVALLQQNVRVEVSDATNYTDEAKYSQLQKVENERKDITKILKTHIIQDPESRYNLEYSTAKELSILTGQESSFEGTHYWFYSPILEPNILYVILEMSETKIAPCRILTEKENRILKSRIIDIGCGNGLLLEKLSLLGVQRHRLVGIDISEQAVKRVCKMFPSICGRIENQKDWFENFDFVFLSYFVDRDENQKETFKKSVQTLNWKGFLVLEGLFPCVLSDSNGVSYGEANVTKGLDPVEDILCVVEECKRLKVVLKKIIVGQRLVYSLDGSEVLPTYILVFQKE